MSAPTVVVPPIITFGWLAVGSSYTESAAATGPTGTVYQIPAYSSVIGIQGITSSALAVFKVQSTTDPIAMVIADTATWADVPGLTGITNATQQAGIEYPITAIRINVTTASAGKTATMSFIANDGNESGAPPNTIDLASSEVTGILPVTKGGIGVNTLTGLAKGNGTGVFTAAAAGTDYVAPGLITGSGLTIGTGKLLGRTTAATGAVEAITAGTGLSLAGGSLTATILSTVQAKNKALLGPISGADAAPTFRLLASEDIPTTLNNPITFADTPIFQNGITVQGDINLGANALSSSGQITGGSFSVNGGSDGQTQDVTAVFLSTHTLHFEQGLYVGAT